MEKWTVTIVRELEYKIDVDAHDKSHAMDKAVELLDEDSQRVLLCKEIQLKITAKKVIYV